MDGAAMELVQGTVDLQINGAFGVDFSSPDLRLTDLEACLSKLRLDGVATILPTLITQPIPDFVAQLRRWNEWFSQSSLLREMCAGIHLEGPFLSAEPGYVGAHRPDWTRDATVEDAKQLHDAADGSLRLVTLAPERDPGARVTEWFANQGVRVAAGHTNASLVQLSDAIDAGLKLFTHLGNGCPVQLPRHDNIIQRALFFSDRLSFSVIADGAHLPYFFLRNLLRSVGIERLIVVSDAIHAAGQGAGTFQLAGHSIRVGEDGVPRTLDGNYLAGSGWTQRRMDIWLASELGLSFEERKRLLISNPEKILSAG